jgi:hypothetical protein
MWVDNFHEHVEGAYKASESFLSSRADLKTKLEDGLWAFHGLGQLIPQTIEKFGSGHYFPYSEAFYNLQSSLELAMYGFYSQAFGGLRSVLELSAMCVYYDINDESHIEVKPWIQSEVRTPPFKMMVNALLQEDYYRRFDELFGLREELQDFYDELGGFVHVRGYKSSSSGLSRANVVVFQPKILEKFAKRQAQTVRLASILMLLKYPIGVIPLPITEKFGLNGPAGGFLEQIDTDHILAVLENRETEFLLDLAKNDKHVQDIIRYFDELPDISEEEFRRQADEFDRFMEEHKHEPKKV